MKACNVLNLRMKYGVLALVALLSAGCSTPPDLEQKEAPEVAWEAYVDCVQSMPQAANTSVCDDIGTSRSRSYSSYNLSGGPLTNTSSGGTRFRSAVGSTTANIATNIGQTRALFQRSYREYLRTLDTREARDLSLLFRKAAGH